MGKRPAFGKSQERVGTRFESVRRSPAKIAGRRDNRDTLKGIEVKEVGIAGDNKTGFAVDSKFEEFVVAGIAARADCVNDWDHLSDAVEETQTLLAFSNGNVGIELGAGEDVGQFLKSGFGDEKLGFINGFVDSPTRDRGRQEKAAARRVARAISMGQY